jgi:hypothetical protein
MDIAAAVSETARGLLISPHHGQNRCDSLKGVIRVLEREYVTPQQLCKIRLLFEDGTHHSVVGGCFAFLRDNFCVSRPFA